MQDELALKALLVAGRTYGVIALVIAGLLCCLWLVNQYHRLKDIRQDNQLQLAIKLEKLHADREDELKKLDWFSAWERGEFYDSTESSWAARKVRSR